MLLDTEKLELPLLEELNSASYTEPTWYEIGLLLLTGFCATASIVFTSPKVEQSLQRHGITFMTRILDNYPGLFWPYLYLFSSMLFDHKLPARWSRFRVRVSLLLTLLAFWSVLSLYKAYSTNGKIDTFEFVSRFIATAITLGLNISKVTFPGRPIAVKEKCADSGVIDGEDEWQSI